jgi:hypothetical protein
LNILLIEELGSTEYVGVQALVLHVFVDQYPLLAFVAVSKETNKTAMPEPSHDFNFSHEICLAFCGQRRLFKPLDSNRSSFRQLPLVIFEFDMLETELADGCFSL